MKTLFVHALFMALCTSAHAAKPDLECYEEPGTRKTTCIDVANVRINGSVRAAKVYIGGPNRVDEKNWLFISDCQRKVSTLQDSQGVNFGGGANSATPAASTLSSALCVAKPVRTDKSLRQF